MVTRNAGAPLRRHRKIAPVSNWRSQLHCPYWRVDRCTANAAKPWPTTSNCKSAATGAWRTIQAPVILMSPNRQSERDRQDACNDYEINLKLDFLHADGVTDGFGQAVK
ncbi:MAG: DUF1003 domain-containing protein [Massilia sp.]|nr:DUF1003 domain-containing protein [Massilia sp.]